MPRSRPRSLPAGILVLAVIAGSAMSCGPRPATTTTTAAQAVATHNYAPMVRMPATEFRPLATMSLIAHSVTTSVRDYLVTDDRATEAQTSTETQAPVEVTFRLGPKMASRTISIGLDGTVAPAELKALRRLFRCRRSRRTHRIHPGLVAKIADLSAHFEGHTLEVISAYRHGKNAKRGSRHRQGRAIDIRVVGVPAAQVRDYLWARYEQEIGVGFYREQQFVHLDHRTDYPATAWTQSHRSDSNDYSPRWARTSRRAKLVVALAQPTS